MDEQRLHSPPQDLDPSKRWVIGAAIFQNPTSENRSLLLLKRASHETAFPNAWELPGGHVEQTDETVAHAVAREVLEETSLTVSEIIGEIEPMTWESKTKSNFQLNYVVTVQPGVTVQPNPDEHSDWLWVQEGQTDSLYMTVEMRKVVQNAFNFCRAA
ncbi:NUDIX hydrolase domain-like protein [Aspergillus caelatus]|uniref:NUDIX hydrolase domain-like protein n=1 Tax=Aspergillus caelatus TaxID=61420 RepID=A0A5N7AIT2_9EURO|nr:NUDIX hydrolase domain-like protein [Aspergillus caelatus]KAE8369794.1 NUDIX hydrolase domain-like protein [Aspergillus caelatus]